MGLPRRLPLVQLQPLPRLSAVWRPPRPPTLLMATLILLLVVNLAFLRGSVHLSTRAHREAWVESQLSKATGELKEAIEQSKRDVFKQIAFTGAGWVKDSDVDTVTSLGAPCDSGAAPAVPQNSSSGSTAASDQQQHQQQQQRRRLRLNRTDPRLVAPIVVLAHSRVKYLAKTMLTLIRHHAADEANAAKFPLFISVDGDSQPTLLLATSLGAAAGVQVVRVARAEAAAGAGGGGSPCPSPWHAYCNLAMHYKAILELFFGCLQAPRLILLEEDLQVAPDFFSYFQATAPLLESDPSLLCVSAWNDHGQAGRAANGSALYRTDVFPGLGWMLTRAVGLELLPTWPPGYWDDNHLRKPSVRRGRQCVFPEVPRTHTFGAVGASNGMFFDTHLATMALNDQPVDWTRMDMSHLHAPRYAALMRSWLAAAQPLAPLLLAANASLTDFCNASLPLSHQAAAAVAAAAHDGGSSQAVQAGAGAHADADTAADRGDLYLVYEGNAGFERLAQQLPPMLFSISGGAQIPRGVYNGTGDGAVIVRCRQRRLFLVSREQQQQQQRTMRQP